MGDPALVFDAELVDTVDTGLAKDNGVEVVDASEVDHVLVADTFATTVG